jgi:hypothetical protein
MLILAPKKRPSIKLGRVPLRENRFSEAEKETLAGYRIVAAQASPSVTWLQQAR